MRTSINMKFGTFLFALVVWQFAPIALGQSQELPEPEGPETESSSQTFRRIRGQFVRALEHYVPGVRADNQLPPPSDESLAPFLAAIHRSVHSEFAERFLGSLPANPADPLNDPSLRAVLEVVINSDGNVDRIGVIESSGQTVFDSGAYRSVVAGAPYSAPPALRSGDGRIWLHWPFDRGPTQCGFPRVFILDNAPEDDAIPETGRAAEQLTDEPASVSDLIAQSVVLDPELVAAPNTEDETEAEGEEEEEESYQAQAEVERPVPPAGSFHRLGAAELERLRLDDPMRILRHVSGVYVRTEDGWGLRPNIGIRGASAERSRQITLMEDGVLFAPAPYSAPAAYYFPLMMRMEGVEVSMGSAAIPYGPHTVGGAVNLINRAIPQRLSSAIDLALGATNMGRLNFHLGDSNRWGGFLAEVSHLQSDGFRQIDQGARDNDTGFDRTDMQLRGALYGELRPGIRHRLEGVVGLGLEDSNETYIGLSDADFRQSPNRRYASSALDHMAWWRTRAELRYRVDFERTQLELVGYRQDLDRTWRRMDRFRDGTSFSDVLARPNTGSNSVYFGILSGREDATLPGQSMILAQNGRRFFSQGLQVTGRTRFVTGDFGHRVHAGVRLHWDGIVRNHLSEGYLMQNQRLVGDGVATEQTLANEATTFATSAFVSYELSFFGFRVSPGIRAEFINGQLTDRLTGVSVNTTQDVFTPGIGVEYEIARPVSVFAGVHQGFSPIAPGQAEGILPELSWNYEVGARYGRTGDTTYAQAVYFVNDYSNLLATCSAGGGCDNVNLDDQYNGGSVLIMGLEATATHELREGDFKFPLRVNYTYSYSRFRSAFESANPQFGRVEEGFRLPYIPEHQLAVAAGLEWDRLRFNVSGAYVGKMFEVAAAAPPPDFVTDDYLTLDANLDVLVFGQREPASGRAPHEPSVAIYVRGENLTNAQPLVSRRPFGARGIRPVMLFAGVQVRY